MSVNTIIAAISLFFIVMRAGNIDCHTQVLAQSVLGIYLIHPFIIEIFAFLTKGELPNILGVYVYIPVFSVAVFLTSFLLVRWVQQRSWIAKYRLV